MRRNRRVKIVATLGPASNNEETMRSLFNAGADVFRVNMSHATHEGLREAHGIVRKLEIEASRPIGILVDLQGPKLRIGKFESGAIRLTEGDILSFVRREAIGGLGRVQLPHPEIFEAVKQGHTLLLDDGKFRLRVVEASDVRIDAEVMTSGVLGSRKGISLPDTVLPLRALTDKDRADVDFALSLGVSWIALSFVQRAEDIAEAKKLARGRAAVMAKIEKPSALTDLKNIVEIADGIMVARGDLGVELPVEKVPGFQKQIIRAARNAGKPVVIATQMLESMIYSPAPTRAEVSDVATAVFEGADAVMLSAEVRGRQISGRGRRDHGQRCDRGRARSALCDDHPRPAHRPAGDRRRRHFRRRPHHRRDAEPSRHHLLHGLRRHRASRRARAALPADHRAHPHPTTGRKLALVWGQHCVLTDDPSDLDDMVVKACRIADREGFAKPGDSVIISAGVPLGKSGATNMLRIAVVGEDSFEGV